MLDIEKLRIECKKTIQSYTREQLLEWVDSYHKRVALAEQEKESSRLNGAIRHMPIQPRAANGRFVSKKVSKPSVRPAKTLTVPRAPRKRVAV
jgi:hypothetical protein